MLKLRRSLIIAVTLSGAAALAQAQTVPSGAAQRAATAPGVTRAVEHPSTAEQTQPDSHQPETATDPPSSGPETARDDTKLKPETATDAPKLSATQQAAEQAKQGVRSNTPPSSKP